MMNNAVHDGKNSINEEDRNRLARILMVSRAKSGMSQERVALELGVAKKTVQNWERGISSPTLPQAIEWFRILGISAMPYFLQYIFPEMEGISESTDTEELRESLIHMIETLPEEGIRQLIYLFYGEHGSSPRGVMNMITAHLQVPMRDRYTHANMILNDYKLSSDKQQTSDPEDVQPDVKLLERAIEHGRKAVLDGKNNYLLIEPRKQ